MWDKIAKTGTYTDMHGKNYTFTVEDFNDIAANYEKASEKAPLVVGHPNTDSPAFGWVGALRVMGDYLEASYEKVADTIKEAVNDGKYQYKSISLFPDLKRLKHVGLLGAVAPAMSGLGEIKFANWGGNPSLVPPPSSPFLREELTARKRCSASFVAKTTDDGVSLSFAEFNIGETKMNPEELLAQIAKLQEEVAKIRAELSNMAALKETAEKNAVQTESNFSAFKKDVSLKARTARVDALIAGGKLEPSKKDEVLKIAEKLSDGSPSFSSGDSLEDDYLKAFEARETNPMLAEFAAPAAKNQEQYSTKDIVEKL